MTTPLFEPDTVRRSLILAGGGVRLAYHAGVLKALEEASVAFNHVDGTSGGIFSTAMLASGLNPEEICTRWRQLNVTHFVSMSPAKNYLRLSRTEAMGDADGIRQRIFPALGIDIPNINRNERFRATFNVCNFSHKTVENIAHKQVSEDFLIAGMSLPISMPSLKINGDWYTDAVWIKDANVMEAVRNGAEEIWLVYCIGNSRDYLDGAFVQYVHMIEMSAAGGLLAEFDWLEQVNEQIRQGNSPYGQTKPVRLQVVKPTFPLPLDPDLFLGHIDIRGLINMGYAETKAYLGRLLPEGVAYEYSAALMAEPGISLQFMAHFEGHCMWQTADSRVCFHALFDLRETTDGAFQVRVFGSLVFGLTGAEVSIYNQQVSFETRNNQKQLRVTGHFVLAGETHNVTAIFIISSPLDFNLGLDFKEMCLRLDNYPESTLFQFAKHRIGHAWKSHLYLNAGWRQRWAMKQKLLRQFYSATSRPVMRARLL